MQFGSRHLDAVALEAGSVQQSFWWSEEQDLVAVSALVGKHCYALWVFSAAHAMPHQPPAPHPQKLHPRRAASRRPRSYSVGRCIANGEARRRHAHIGIHQDGALERGGEQSEHFRRK